MRIPPREDDSPEAFRKQQEALAKEVRRKMDERFDKELKDLLDREEGS